MKVMLLMGNNLGKRQQEFNMQVSDVVARKVDLEQLVKKMDSTDINILFSIDVASKYKNVKYILEILMSGDSLHISRALKCTWLYDEQYSEFINTEYLHHNIFPSMSLNMKRKFLCTISMHVRDENRNEGFYMYSLSEKLQKIALKFLIYTSEPFKLYVISQSFSNVLQHQEAMFYKNFVGNSFVLAKAIMMEASDYVKSKVLYYLRYFMSVSEDDYLDLLEEYDHSSKAVERFGLRISKRILKKHRSRYLKHPVIYLGRLNKELVTKYINVDDAKQLITNAFPEDSIQFWEANLGNRIDFVIKKIPQGERFQFIKKCFNEKYPNESFEMDKRFFNLCYQELMTVDEKEQWALQHLASGTEIQGIGFNYRWYQYVKFEKAFPEIKLCIAKTPDYRNRRDIIDILTKCVRNLADMENLLQYYYNRHINEACQIKEEFICTIIREHNVFQFNKECWAPFNKILHSLKVYKTIDTCNNSLIMYMTVMYHIIFKIDLPECLRNYILGRVLPWRDVKEILYEKICKERQEQVYEFIANVYVSEVTKLSAKTQDNDNIHTYIERYISFLERHKKNSSDCSPIIMEIVGNKSSYYQNSSFFKSHNETLTEAMLMRLLKKDSNEIKAKLKEIKESIIEKSPKVNNFLSKLHIYFENDLASNYLVFLIKMLDEKVPMSTKAICNVVYGIIQLADDATKAIFMSKHAPTEAKINHEEIDERLLGIQEGICKCACFSRPPVPLSFVIKFIKGDYLKFCLPMFQSYKAKLPQPLLQEFAIALLDAPISIQKHALRLVFSCFGLEELKRTISDSWEGTTSVSLRFVLYQSLFDKICCEEGDVQLELFDILISFTKELHEYDHVEIFEHYVTANKLPHKLLGIYHKNCWRTVNTFPDSSENYRLKRKVIDNMTNHINIMDADFIREIVDDHVLVMIVKSNIRPSYGNDELDSLNAAKWKLVCNYFIYFSSDIHILYKNIDVVKLILSQCYKMWEVTHDDIFTYRKFCWKFIDDLINTYTDRCCSESLPIFESILTFLNENFTLKNSYNSVWALRLTILRRKTKLEIKANYECNTNPNLLKLIQISIYDFGKKVGKLIKEYLEKGAYFNSGNNMIANMVKDNIDNIMNVNITDNTNPRLLYEGLKNRYVIAAQGISEIYTKETYLIAIYILPLDGNDTDFLRLIDKIEHFPNEEVQYCWYNKYIHTDFKRRRL